MRPFKVALLFLFLNCVISIGLAQEPAVAPAVDHSDKSKTKQFQIDTSQRYIRLTTNRFSTLRRELDQVAAAGYRVVHGCASSSLVLEKSPENFSYRVIKHLNKEFDPAVKDGFHPVPTTFCDGAIAMEKSERDTGMHEYLFVDAIRVSTLQKELNEAAAKGYALIGFESTSTKLLMEKRSASGDPQRYLALTTFRLGNLTEALNEARTKGYAVAMVVSDRGPTVVMEKSATVPSEYLVLSPWFLRSLEKDINEATARGFRPVPLSFVWMSARYQPAIIMEKAPETAAFSYEIVDCCSNDLATATGDIVGYASPRLNALVLLRNAASAQTIAEAEGKGK